MAIQTKTLGSVSDTDGTQATLQVDYDDQLLRLTLVRVINGTGRTARVTATAVANPSRTYTLNAAPHQTSTQNIPTGAQTRLDVTVDARGRVDGVDYQFLLL